MACAFLYMVVLSHGKEGFYMSKTRQSQLRATAKYQKANTTQIKFTLNHKTDKDILDRLEAVENKQGYFKALVRADIAGGQDTPTRTT